MSSQELYWLSVDTDDLGHLPNIRGHPTRSSTPMPEWRMKGYVASDELLSAMDNFHEWITEGDRHVRIPVTLFVIAEQLDCPAFAARLDRLAKMAGITIGCHGWSHRCWSAWPEDQAGFTEMLEAARNRISEFAGSAWRPWFRAPGGYIAPWMAGPLAASGFRLDSSVNPTPLLRRKAGSGNHWGAVSDAMHRAGIVEREWHTLRPLLLPALPATGPALTLPILGLLARNAWRRSTKVGRIASEELVEDVDIPVTALYWHLLDHGRSAGCWSPPLHPSVEGIPSTKTND